MKQTFLRKILMPYLAWCARRIVAKNKPLVIGITGSVGKSSTKEAIYCVLKDRFRVRKSQGNLNNEIGLPLAVIGETDPRGNWLDWAGILVKGFLLTLKKSRSYPKILILEMAVDRPGDMKYLVNLAPPKIGVITDIGVTHWEFFHDEKKILQEKAQMVKNIPADGLAVLNHDNAQLRSFAKNFSRPVLTYGFRAGADVLASDLKIGYAPDLGEGVNLANGASFRVSYKTIFLPFKLPDVISKTQVSSALAAATIGIKLGMNLVEIGKNLKEYEPLPGRMRLLRGKRGNLIIDDTYNSAPSSVKSALEILAMVKSKKKTVILGDMLELGSLEEKSHRDLAKLIYPVANKIILVGKRTTATHKELRKLGFQDKIYHFRLVTNLLPKLPSLVGKGEVILVKGSQGLRMEKAVEELVIKKELPKLTRQDKYWKRKAVKEV
jgi:UDP-N-acetylmuramoyl-tripeptide--D-alanyl-D-alanine ligase